MDNVNIAFPLMNAAVQICNVISALKLQHFTCPCDTSRLSLSPLFDCLRNTTSTATHLQLRPSTWFILSGKNILLGTPLQLTQTYTRTALPTGYCQLTGSVAPRPGKGVHHVKVKERTWVAVSVPDGGLI